MELAFDGDAVVDAGTGIAVRDRVLATEKDFFHLVLTGPGIVGDLSITISIHPSRYRRALPFYLIDAASLERELVRAGMGDRAFNTRLYTLAYRALVMLQDRKAERFAAARGEAAQRPMIVTNYHHARDAGDLRFDDMS